MDDPANRRHVAVVVWVLAGIATIFATIIPACQSISERSERVNRVAKARSVITACIAYSKDWDKFPPNLEALIPIYIDDESILTPDENGNSPYLYRPGLSPTDYSREPIIMCRRPDNKGNRLIGFVGGHVVESGTVPPEILLEFE